MKYQQEHIKLSKALGFSTLKNCFSEEFESIIGKNIIQTLFKSLFMKARTKKLKLKLKIKKSQFSNKLYKMRKITKLKLKEKVVMKKFKIL